MKNPVFKRNLILGLVVVVLAGAVFFVANPDRQRQKRRDHDMRAKFSESMLSSIEMVQFQQGELIKKLVKEGEAWSFESEEGRIVAKNETVENFFEELKSFPQGDRVSKNNQNRADYSVNGDQKMVLMDADGEILKEVFFGGPGLKPGTVYVSYPEEEGVWSAKTTLRNYLGYQLVYWADKQFIGTVKDDVKSFTVRIGEERWSFEKDEEDVWQWLNDESSVPVKDEMPVYLASLLGLQASSVETDLSLFVNPDAAIAVQLQDGSEMIVEMDEEGENLLVRKSGTEYLLSASSSLLETLRPIFLESLEASPESLEQ